MRAFPASREHASHVVIGNLRPLILHLARHPNDVLALSEIRVPGVERFPGPGKILVGRARRHHMRQLPGGESVEAWHQLVVLVRLEVIAEAGKRRALRRGGTSILWVRR